jgi:hypothetical protein
MSGASPAQRVRHAFLRTGAMLSVLGFFILGSGDLVSQWLAGHVGAGFMLGTLLINVGLPLGMFGIIAAIGYFVSIALGEHRPHQPSAADTKAWREAAALHACETGG